MQKGKLARQMIILAMGALVLAGCGSGRGLSGEIGRACMGSGRQAASPALCACVQRAADQSLSRSEQSRAVAFFEDPHLAQETRQSNRASDEAFWQRYRAFANRAEQMCR